MRYFRMLSNAVVAALLASAYIVVLVLDLNPTLPINLLRAEPVAVRVGAFYAVHLVVVWYVLLVVRQVLAHEVFSPAWTSVAELSWMGALAAGGGSVLMLANLQTFRIVLESGQRDALAGGAATLGVAAVAFVAIGVTRVRLDGRGRRPLAAALVATAMLSVVVPGYLRGPAVAPLLEARMIDVGAAPVAPEHPPTVTLIAVDGASLDFITSATAEGKLPNFGRLLDAGAVRRLATLHPTSAEAVWAAVSTGKLPQKNGIRSAAVYRLAEGGGAIEVLPDHCFAHALVRSGVLVEEPHNASSVRTRTLFSILSGAGIPVGVVAWPLTYPAPAVRGYIVSDAYVRLSATPSAIDDASALSPADLQLPALRAIDASAEVPGVPDDSGPDPSFDPHEKPARSDRLFDRIARTLAADRPTPFMAVRYQGLDAVGHYFLRYATPGEFGDVTEEEVRRLGTTLERHYTLIDAAIGRVMAGLGRDDLLLVVSSYGMEPMGTLRRMVERVIGNPELSGTHDAAPDGFLLAYGGMVAKGRPASRASVLDVTPTVLYFMGLPVGRDMDGFALTDLFQPSYTADRPITLIPTHDR